MTDLDRESLLTRMQTQAMAAWACVAPEQAWDVCRDGAMRRKFREIAVRLLREAEQTIGEQVVRAAARVLTEQQTPDGCQRPPAAEVGGGGGGGGEAAGPLFGG